MMARHLDGVLGHVLSPEHGRCTRRRRKPKPPLIWSRQPFRGLLCSERQSIVPALPSVVPKMNSIELVVFKNMASLGMARTMSCSQYKKPTRYCLAPKKQDVRAAVEESRTEKRSYQCLEIFETSGDK